MSEYSQSPNSIDFLVIGAQKTATSWLFDCLSEHPEIVLPKKKREVEYIGGEIYDQRGPEWYFSLMGSAQQGQQRGDVSVEYLYNAKSASMVHALLPKVKLVCLLRDPVDRAISAFYWGVRKGYLAPDDINSGLSIATERYIATTADGSKPSGDKYAEVIERSLYGKQITRYTSLFPATQFMFVFYDDVKVRPLDTLEAMFKFLGVHENFVPNALNKRPKVNTYSPFLIRLERMVPRARLLAGAVDRVSALVSRHPMKQPQMSSTVRQVLTDIFSSDLARAKEAIGAIRIGGGVVSSAVFPMWLERNQS